MNLRSGAGLLLALFLSGVVSASDGGRTAADFLNIGVDARSAALGGTGTVLAENVAAAYWNPGGLTTVTSRQVLLSHFALYQDIALNYLGAAFPLGERYTLAAGFAYLGYGSIEGYDASNNATGDVNSTYDAAANISMGYALSDAWSAGMTVKYIIISLAGQKAITAAADFGFRFSRRQVTVAATLANFGGNIKFNRGGETLPSAVRFGIAVRAPGDALQVAGEFDHPLHADPAITSGLEYGFAQKYFLRAGYRHTLQTNTLDAVNGLTFGAGAVFGPTQLDYSYSPGSNAVADNLHRFSFLISF